MLLVKSRESKNLNKICTSSPVLTCFSSIFITTLSWPVQAKTSGQSLTSASSILSVFLSLLVVIAIIFAFAYVMRRFNVASAGHGQMRVVASMSAGTKEKVMVIDVGGEQHLLGITAHNINHLATLKTPISKDKPNADPEQNSHVNFQQKLVNAMAQSISGSKPSKDANKQSSKGVDHD
jgi:flagellar protein FliO/FliZ